MADNNQPTPLFPHKRLDREFSTISAMISIYCNAHHDDKSDICNECSELLQYAEKRLLHCPFQENKTTCGNCPIHCYKKSMQERIRTVMRYSGPRMMYHHPIKALLHLFDGRKKPPTPKPSSPK